MNIEPSMRAPYALQILGSQFLRELQPGEKWMLHAAGGVIVVHPERPPVWCRFVDGKPLETVIEFPEHMTATEVAARNLVDGVPKW